MEMQDNMGEEEIEPEGSAIITPLLNASTDGSTNFTNITFFPYYQHSFYVAASYVLAYSFIFLLCMVGNLLVCLIVLENRCMRTVTNLFILNLAISDLLVGIFCIPTTLVDNLITGWPFSNTVCKMSGFIQGVSVSASVFTLVAIAVERFRCIVYPLQPKLTILVAKVAIVTIWVLALVIMCPSAVVLTVEKVPFHFMVYNDDFNNTLPLYTCYENFTKPQMRKVYTAVLFAHIYLAPLTVIMLMYVSIGVKLCSSVVANREPQMANAAPLAGIRRHVQPMISHKKIKVIKMLVVVALLFMLSWLPLWTLLMMADYGGLDRDQLDLLTSYIFPFAHWLAFSNSSVNPIVYGYYNKNFKRGFQSVCKSKSLCCMMYLRSQFAKWGRKRRSVQGRCEGGDLSDDINNHNNFVLGMRNRVHNNNKLSETPEANRGLRVGCVEVHSGASILDQGVEMTAIQKKSSSGETSEKVSSLAVSVYQAWDN